MKERPYLKPDPDIRITRADFDLGFMKNHPGEQLLISVPYGFLSEGALHFYALNMHYVLPEERNALRAMLEKEIEGEENKNDESLRKINLKEVSRIESLIIPHSRQRSFYLDKTAGLYLTPLHEGVLEVETMRLMGPRDGRVVLRDLVDFSVGSEAGELYKKGEDLADLGLINVVD
ncbi:MAG: hypothetical protein JW727_04205 [Candidatus Aenigmarchaeota archaeon]|nr:hypothetical protein [Candidatus Aenigmarchaeota archaeon]